MKAKNSNILKKTIKIASFTCVALGGAALVASGAALKALTEGAKYMKNTVQKILEEGSETEAVNEAVTEEAVFAEETVAEESSATEESCDQV